MRKLRWAIPAAAAVALLTSSVTLAGRSSIHRVAGAQTFTVNVDGHPAGANESFLRISPHSITVHAGDTVVFHSVGVGEPHTVTLGTLANNAVLTFRHLTPAQQQANTPPPEMLAADAPLPQLLPQGPGDATQSAANPCYMPSGNPGTKLCPRSQFEQPVFDGTQSYYNSGWLNSGQKWSVHLSSTTSVGTYRFMCLLHREDMGREDHSRAREQDDHEPGRAVCTRHEPAREGGQAARDRSWPRCTRVSRRCRTSSCRARTPSLPARALRTRTGRSTSSA